MINTITRHKNINQLSWHTKSTASERDALKNGLSNGVSKSVNKNVNRGLRETAEINFCGLSPNKASWFYKSDKVKWMLENATDKQLIFDAAFALILTCIFRPASIVVLPSKKNKDDQKYAAAHSIASGIIGFAISNIVFTPISNAIKKIKDKPTDFIKDKKLLEIDKGKTILNKTAKNYIDRLPDILGSVPKGILTIALIPPILKYCFGWEKKKPQDKSKTGIPVDYTLLHFKSTNNNDKKSHFVGGLK